MLENISLSFYPGAKIGVIGSNGAGKSSLLKIMAGLDDGFSGRGSPDARFHRRLPGPGAQLDPDKNVKGNVMDGVAEVQSIIDEYNEVMAKWADPDADYDKIGKQQADPRRQDRRDRRLDASSATSTSRWMRCAARPTTPTSPCSPAASADASRCAACCSSRPDLLLLDEPTNHLDAESVAWLERFLSDYAGTVVAITHDRYFLDNVAQWILELDRGTRHPVRGQLLVAGSSRSRSASHRRSGQRGPPAHARPRARVGADGAQGPPGEGQGPPRRLRQAAAEAKAAEQQRLEA